MAILPRDIELKLISLMDIDSRRALGIYSKLNVPKGLQDKIKSSLQKLNVSKTFASVKLGVRRIYSERVHTDNIYVITRGELWDDETNRLISSCYFVEHVDIWFNHSNGYFCMNMISSYDTPEFSLRILKTMVPLSSLGA